MTDVVIHQHSRKLLMMGILCPKHVEHIRSEIASDIKLVFHSSTIIMMHGPINIRSITDWNRLPEGAIGTCHGKTHVFKTRGGNVKTSEGK